MDSNREVIPGNSEYYQQGYSQQVQQEAYPQYQQYQQPVNPQDYKAEIKSEEQRIIDEVNSLPFDMEPTDEEVELPFNQRQASVIKFETQAKPAAVEKDVSVLMGPPAKNMTEAPLKEKVPVEKEKYISQEYERAIKTMHHYREEHNLTDTNLFLPIIREYFKDEKATYESINEENIHGLINHLAKLQS